MNVFGSYPEYGTPAKVKSSRSRTWSISNNMDVAGVKYVYSTVHKLYFTPAASMLF